MAAAGIPYLVILRNWSYIHDFASFFVIGSIAIAGGLGIELIWNWLDHRITANNWRRIAAVAAGVFFVSMGWAGFIQGDAQRSQFIILDGIADEPDNLIADVGQYLGKNFSEDATILCNFDPSYSPISYYAKRDVVRNLASIEEWKSEAAENGPDLGGIIWLDAPSAPGILAALPADEIVPVEIDGIRFAIWRPRSKTAG